MKVSGIAFGILLGAVGVVWIGQGLGYIPGSFMTGSTFWAWMGLLCLVAGLGLVLASVRGERRRAARPPR